MPPCGGWKQTQILENLVTEFYNEDPYLGKGGWLYLSLSARGTWRQPGYRHLLGVCALITAISLAPWHTDKH